MKKKLSRILRRLFWDESGATAIEYAIIASLIAVAVISSVGQVATRTRDTFNTSGDAINKSLSP